MVEHDKNIRLPKGEIRFCLAAMCVIFADYLCVFLTGYGSNTAFLCLPVTFLFGVILVPITLIFLVIRMYKYWDRYSKRGKYLRIFFSIAIPFFIICYPINMKYLPVYGIRLRVATTGGVDELQSWAVNLLEKPREQILAEDDHETKLIKRELYSEQIRQISPPVVYLNETENGEPFLHIPLAGGFFSGWGIKIGRPTFQAEEYGSMYLQKWKDGVYGFSL